MLMATALVAGWLWQQPSLLSSDDALHFSRGIDRFSVLEFSPHFPGYPAFILLARLLTPFTDEAVTALLWLTRGSTLLLPWLSWLLLRQSGATSLAAGCGFLLCLSSPLLNGLGLLGLSDGPALCWLVAAFVALIGRRYLLAGLLLGGCLATRPSLAPLLALPLLQILITEPQSRRRLLASLTTVALISLTYLLSRDGMGWFSEGLRFIDGHFRLWGNSALSDSRKISWPEAAAGLTGSRWLLPTLITVLLAGQWWLRRHAGARVRKLLTLFLINGLLWTLLAQNPENLRHLVPLLWALISLSCLTLSALPYRPAAVTALMALMLLTLVRLPGLLDQPADLPPVQQAARILEQRKGEAPRMLASNYGVELLRHRLPDFTVTDSYYPGAAARVLSRGGWRLSSTHPDSSQLLSLELYHLPARTPAEKTLWLFRSHP